MAAQSNIEINLINLSSIALSVQSVSPPNPQWSSSGGATQPNVGDTLGTDAGTSSLSYLLSNNNNLNVTGSIILTGNYNNQWQLSFSWLQTGTPQATLLSLSSEYSGLRVAGYAGAGFMQLPNLQPNTDTAIYNIVFNKP